MSKLTFTTRCGILLTAIFMHCLTLSAQVTSLPGSGSTADPYRITTIAELKWMRDKVNNDNVNFGNKAYKLMEDLNFKDEGDWTPIGDYSSPLITFRGTFDGNNKKIFTIKIGPSVTPNNIIYAGLFGYVTEGTIKNLGIDWTGNYSYSTNSSYAGGIVGYNLGTIVNCYSSGIISAMSPQKSAYAGGIAGWNGGRIVNSYSSGSVIAKTEEQANAGGIVGYDQKGFITNCYASGTVQATGNYAYASGIAGQNISSTFTNCFALNKLITAISISKNYFANRISTLGLLLSTNYASFNMIVKVGISATDLTQLTNLDGLNHGLNFEGMPLNQLNNWVKTNSVTYGVTNYNWKVDPALNNGFPIFELPVIAPPVTSLPGSGTTADPYRISSVAELKFMRDKVNSDNANYGDKVYKLMADLDFTGEVSWVPIGLGSFKGTFDGRGNVIRNILLDGLTLPLGYSFSGLFGFVDGGTIMKLGIEWKSISISNTNTPSYSGGIVGYLKSGIVTDCYTTGPISSVTIGNAGNTTQSFAGGIVGHNFGQITNCYSIGTITSSSSPSNSNAKAGGIVGQNNGLVINCYSMRDVSVSSTGYAYAGGIVGTNDSYMGTEDKKGNIINCYTNGNVMASSTEYYSYTGGIAGGSTGNIVNCLALNNAITAIAISSSTKASIARVCPNWSTSCYASGKMIVKKGSSTSDLTTVTNFNNSSDGTNLIGLPLTILNNWVTANPITNGIANKTWKVVTGINNGFPIFGPTVNNLPSAPSGSGTISDPYGISSIGNLKWMRDKVNTDNVNYGNKTYKLLADLDFEEDEDWEPIGNSSQLSTNPFTGTFDGNNKVIRNIHIGTPTTPSKTENVGLFGVIQNGSVSNLGVEWSGIYSTSTCAGGITGLNYGILFNCHTSGEVSSLSSGGLAGKNYGQITNCYTLVSVTSTYYSGGIAGQNYGPITNCYTLGAVSALSSSSLAYAGGIAGENQALISNCYSIGSITASSTGNAYASGITYNNTNGNITNCIALNSSITAIASSLSGTFAYRTGNSNGSFINYAFNSIVVKTGTSKSNLNMITTFNDGAKNIDQPLNVLNNWVDKAKITSTGQELYTWKVIDGTNGGYPIFDSLRMALSPLKGSGTLNDPYLITNVADLWTVTIKVKNENAIYRNKVYKLVADLDFTGQRDWIPIGGADTVTSFKGIFDGNGKIIRNIKIGSPTETSDLTGAGLFGSINKVGKVINLGVQWTGIYIYSESYTSFYVGAIAGKNSGIITNCNGSGVLSLIIPKNSSFIGGISGDNQGTINNCNTSVIAASIGYTNTYTSDSYRNHFDGHAGGISGMNSGTISNCFATGTTTAQCAGGIVGENYGTDKNNAIIINSYSFGAVNALSEYDLDKSMYSSGKIYAGGIAGSSQYSKISNCLALNSSIIGITSSTDPTYQSIYRISPGYNISNNYASASIVVKSGKSDTGTTLITSFTGPNHGADLYGKPLSLLNDWVNANPATNGIPNKQWKVVEGINNGLPIFEGQTMNQVQSCTLLGSGTNSDPYRINTIEELKLMRDLVNFNNINDGNKYYRLMSDLDFGYQEDWFPIGNSEINSFKGTFDGNGKVIKNINMGSLSAPSIIKDAGLYGYIKGGNVINLGVNWTGIYINSSSETKSGGIVANNVGGSIVNCYTNGTIYSSSLGARATVGGIVGAGDSGSITNCYSTSWISALDLSVHGEAWAGGISGGGRGSIINCYSTGSIFALSTASALSGGISAASILNSYCLGLNSKITTITSSISEGLAYRISYCPSPGNILSTNYASPLMKVFKGTSESNLINITDFSDQNHGIDIKEQPVTLLNNWVDLNNKTNGIATKRWKIINGTNNDYPIFEDQTITGLFSTEKAIKSEVKIYSNLTTIVVEGDDVGQIKVFNVNGQMLKQCIAISNRTIINMLQTGVYIVVTQDRNNKQSIYSNKVILAQ